MKNPLELYKLLNKSNCKKCMLPSCMAFSVAVIQGRKKISDCPELDEQTVEALSGRVATRASFEDEQRERLNNLKQEVARIDFVSVSDRIGGAAVKGGLAVNCLGKDFVIDAAGELTSECHKNLWVHVPLLNYIIHGTGKTLSGHWVPFNELQGAKDWSRFFSHRCEEDMKQLADAHTELFFEILSLFGAQPVGGMDADHSLTVYPLPKVPFMINYWEPEQGFESKLNILLDRVSPDNLAIGSIYLLGRGLVEMFRALIIRHNRDGKLF
ncbi:MAG: DUF3786 domain-containing protein [Deltaproteobacteria bacterium]|nr:DUF3786 domain-containing protein [Deltaproteobacteria bacterium]